MAGTVLLISTSVACDMQQDRSTGWRLGTNRVIQFRYQVAGILMGAIMAVVFAKLFMAAYPVLLLDQTVMKAAEQPAQWSVGDDLQVRRRAAQPHRRQALPAHRDLGRRRHRLRDPARAQAHQGERSATSASSRAGARASPSTSCSTRSLLPSPYALSFGGFVNLNTSLWFGAGGIVASLFNTLREAKAAPWRDGCRRT